MNYSEAVIIKYTMRTNATVDFQKAFEPVVLFTLFASDEHMYTGNLINHVLQLVDPSTQLLHLPFEGRQLVLPGNNGKG